MRPPRVLAAAALVGTTLGAVEVKTIPTAPPVAKKVVAVPGLASPMLPDLKLTAKPTNGNGPVFDFKIENIGKVPSKEASIRFYVLPPCKRWVSQTPPDIGSGRLLLEGDVKALIVTTSASYASSYSVEMPLDWRGCRLRAVVDHENALAELSNDNNEATIETNPAPRPDLVVFYLPSQHDSQAFPKVLVRNKGNAPAGASLLQFRCYSEKVNVHGNEVYPCDVQGNMPSKTWTFNVPALTPNQDHQITAPVRHQTGKITIRLDINNQVKEANETNNEFPAPQYGD